MVESVSIWTYYCTEEFLVEGYITALYHGVAYIQLVEGGAKMTRFNIVGYTVH